MKRAVAEAPAKAIVTGEHFVVDGSWALAVALPRKVRAEVTEADELRVDSEAGGGSGSPRPGPVLEVVRAMSSEFSFAPSFRVSIRSQVPAGSGLGSSAATSVAVAAAVARYNSVDLGASELARMSMVGEKRVHRTPSGVDSAVCAAGGAVLFRRGAEPRTVHLPGARSLVIAFSGQRRATRRQISKVSRLRDAFPHMFEGLAAAVGAMSLEASERLASGDMETLGRILNLNHAVLSSIGVSNQRLDSMVDASLSMGAFGAKLTGAGGGGCILVAAPEGKEKSIVSGLRGRGFEAFLAEIPVEGVKSWLES